MEIFPASTSLFTLERKEKRASTCVQHEGNTSIYILHMYIIFTRTTCVCVHTYIHTCVHVYVCHVVKGAPCVSLLECIPAKVRIFDFRTPNICILKWWVEGVDGERSLNWFSNRRCWYRFVGRSEAEAPWNRSGRYTCMYYYHRWYINTVYL